MKPMKPIRPALNVGKAQSLEASPSSRGDGTRRRSWTARLFSPLLSSRSSPTKDGGQISYRSDAYEAIETMKSSRQTDEGSEQTIVECADRLLAACASLSKIEAVAKAGALQALVGAMREHAASPRAISSLLPVLINLSAGDDNAGARRRATLLDLCVLEVVSELLEEATGRHAVLCSRCAWVVHHMCSRDDAGHPWLSRTLALTLPERMCKAVAAHPDEYVLQLRGCGAFLAFAAVAATQPGIMKVEPMVEALTRALLRAVDSKCSLSRAHDIGILIEKCALGLGDICISTPLCMVAAEHGLLESVTAAMEVSRPGYEPTAAIMENVACAIITQCDHGGEDTVNRLAAAGAFAGVIRAVDRTTNMPWSYEPKKSLERMRAKACHALAAMAAFPTARQVHALQLADAGAIEASCNALQAMPKNADVTLHACTVLYHVCQGQRTHQDAAVAAGAIPGIVGALRKHMSKKGVQEMARAALLEICYTEKLQQTAMMSGGRI